MRVGLFVTCLVDAVRPEIGFSTLKLLEAAGYEVVVPDSQTCCGQPAYNSGDSRTACRTAVFRPEKLNSRPGRSSMGLGNR